MRTSCYTSLYLFVFICLALPFTGASDWEQASIPVEYNLPFRVGDQDFTTHCLLYGQTDLKHRTPLIVIHGGPGFTSDYMLPLSDLSASHNLSVILYDQLGGGRSSHNPDAPAAFWTVDLFMDQLQSVIDSLQIGEFSLLGNGWGSTLALEYAVRRQPTGLKSLVLSDGLASMQLYSLSMGQLLQEFPSYVERALMNGLTDPFDYESAFRDFYSVHGWGVSPTPKELEQTLHYLFGVNGVGGDPSVALVAQVLSPPNWSIIDRLHLIHAKTLVINGYYSVSQDFVVEPLVEGIADAKWVQFENSSQMPWWSEPERYKQVVGDFLRN